MFSSRSPIYHFISGIRFLMSGITFVLIWFIVFVAPGYASYDVSLYMLDGNGDPITTALDLRISLWDVYDVRDEDFDELDGSLNTSASHYGAYQTVVTDTPNADGKCHIYTSDLTSFPALSPFNAYMHVEYKASGAPDTDYVTYDFIDDPPFQNVTRFLLDTNAGGYYTLDAGPRTNWNTFLLDANSSAPTAVALQFGEELAETLQFHISNARFELSDDLSITGGLSAIGNVDFQSASQFFVPQGSSDPGTCTEGEQFYNTIDNALNVCIATNTWAGWISPVSAQTMGTVGPQ